MKDLLANPANRPTLVLGSVCLFLMVLLLVHVVATPDTIDLPPVDVFAGDLPQPAVVAAVDMPSLAEFEVVVERPLFNEDRLPAEDEDAEGADEEMVETITEAPEVTLAGVVLTGDQQIAMLVNKGEALRLKVGMDVEGWVLESLEPRRAVLSNGSNSLELELPLYVAPPPRTQRERERVPPGQAKKQAREEGEDDSDMTVRERIQKAREERERMREFMREKAEGKTPSTAEPGNK